MWLCVDRLEGEWVVLTDEAEAIYRLSVADYTVLTGRKPRESDILSATVEAGRITAARVDDDETARRKEAARIRLDRLFGRRP